VTLRRIENLISHVLRIGVTVSLLVVVLGTVISFIHHPGYLKMPAALAPLTAPASDTPPTLHDVWTGALAWRGQSLVMVGLILLIATPVLRVAVSVAVFLIQRDRVFVLITLLVFALLMASYFVGAVG
jgi:uncharacterized membrane protein